MKNKKVGIDYIQENFTNEWWKNCLLIKTETGAPDLPIFLMNADLERNRDWIYFVLINLAQDKEEVKIKLLKSFFFMRKIPEDLFGEKFPSQMKAWKKLGEKLTKDWKEHFSGQKGFYHCHKFPERETIFRLFFNKYVFNEKNQKTWQEWETLAKASFAHDFDLLGEIICKTISYFSEEGKIEKLPVNEDEEVRFKVEFDIDPEKVPDVSITSEKNDKEKIWIEVVEVSSDSTKIKGKKGKEKHEKLEKKITGLLTYLINNGEINPETKIDFLEKPNPKINIIDKKKETSVASWDIPKEINGHQHLMDELKRTIKEKNDIWERKDYKNLENMALWIVPSTVFMMYLLQPVNDKICQKITNEEIQKDYFSCFFLKIISQKLSNIEIKFDYLIITFLGVNHYEKDSFLNKHDHHVKIKKEKREILKGIPIPNLFKYLPSTGHVEAAIPNLYIPVKNGEIKNLEEELKERERKFKERWKIDINSLIFWEVGTKGFSLYNKF